MSEYYKIRPKSGTASQWATANTVLGVREIGFEVPTGGVGKGLVKMKMGDGVTPWNKLPYAIVDGLSVTAIVQNLDTDATDKVPSVSAVKKRIPFDLGIDENGKYGYIKAGADTVTPFNTDFGDIILGNFATHNLDSIKNASAIKSSFDSAIDVVMNMDTTSPQEFNMQTISCGVFFNRDKKYKYMYLCRTKQTYTSAYIRGVIVSATGYGANDIVIKTDASATDGPITTVAKKINISEYDYVLAYPYCGWTGGGSRYMPVVFSQNEYF